MNQDQPPFAEPPPPPFIFRPKHYVLSRVQIMNLASEFCGHVLTTSGDASGDQETHVDFTEAGHRDGFSSAIRCFRKPVNPTTQL